MQILLRCGPEEHVLVMARSGVERGKARWSADQVIVPTTDTACRMHTTGMDMTHLCCALGKRGLIVNRPIWPRSHMYAQLLVWLCTRGRRMYEAVIWMTNASLENARDVRCCSTGMCWHVPGSDVTADRHAASARHAGRTSRPKLGNAILISCLLLQDTVDSRAELRAL
jgi:hypothetical protein